MPPALTVTDTAPIRTERRVSDAAHEHAILMVIPCLALVTARNKHQRPVFHRHVVQRYAHFEQVVVGVRIESPILVPLHGGSVTAVFHIEFVVVIPKISPKQAFHNIQNWSVAGVSSINRVSSDGMLDAAYTGRCGTMPRLKIEDPVVRGDVPGLVDKLVCHTPQLFQLGNCQYIFNCKVTVPVIGFRSDFY